MATVKDVIKLLDRGDVDGALALSEDVRDRKNTVHALNDYAAMLGRTTTNYDTVSQILEKVVELDPKSAHAHYNLGCVYSEPQVLSEDEGKLKKAFGAYKRAVRLKPKFLEAHYNIGLLYAFTGDTDKARTEYGTLLKLDAENASKYDHLEGVIKEKEAE